MSSDSASRNLMDGRYLAILSQTSTRDSLTFLRRTFFPRPFRIEKSLDSAAGVDIDLTVSGGYNLPSIYNQYMQCLRPGAGYFWIIELRDVADGKVIARANSPQVVSYTKGSLRWNTTLAEASRGTLWVGKYRTLRPLYLTVTRTEPREGLDTTPSRPTAVQLDAWL